jgi:hypothetical protein
MTRLTASERLWNRVIKTADCWLWTGYTNKKGYGRMRGENGKNIYVHQLSYLLNIGPIPQGKLLDHLCRNPRCVNPAHLEAVTNFENIRRGNHYMNATHCKHGHPFSPENTKVVYRRGGAERVCRECLNALRRRRRALRRAA